MSCRWVEVYLKIFSSICLIILRITSWLILSFIRSTVINVAFICKQNMILDGRERTDVYEAQGAFLRFRISNTLGEALTVVYPSVAFSKI